jgi:peptide chain release factor 1
MFKKLDEVEKRYNHVQQQLSRPGVTDDQKAYQALMKDLSDLDKVVSSYQEYKKVEEEIKANKDLIANESDVEIREMAKEELPELMQKKDLLVDELKLSLLPKDPNDEKNVIIEIRAGAGGDEASLFAEQLFKAYGYYASKRKWQMRLLSLTEGNQGGVKEIIATITGDRVFSNLKFESGVHRVQRVPKTESQGRVHTSTVTVAIIPEVEEVDVKINPNDLRIDVYRSSGNGGQSVNTTDSAVRITHLPTNTVVTCQDGKSQLSNKLQAMKVLASRLQAAEDDKAQREASDTRLSQIGTGDRSERIRTYNFPQSRITDHRIGLTTHALNEVMSGEFPVLIDPLITHYQAEALKQQAT